MGFRTGAYATIWETNAVSESFIKARISISVKNKQTDQYEDEFTGFVAFVGTATAKKAAVLKARDRIKLGDVDVTNTYDREKKREYTNFKIFSFEMADGQSNSSAAPKEKAKPVDEGEPEPDNLPF